MKTPKTSYSHLRLPALIALGACISIFTSSFYPDYYLSEIGGLLIIISISWGVVAQAKEAKRKTPKIFDIDSEDWNVRGDPDERTFYYEKIIGKNKHKMGDFVTANLEKIYPIISSEDVKINDDSGEVFVSVKYPAMVPILASIKIKGR